MESKLFRFIWKHSRAQQLLVLVLTLTSFPLLYASLELPKIVINDAIGGSGFPRTLLGYDFDQVAYLLVLCAILLVLVLGNGAVKMWVNIYKGVMAERLLRRLRYLLVVQMLRFPASRFRAVSSGELVSMITAETEPLGGFFGDALALPVFQGGVMVTILTFMFMQDPILGLASISMIPLQAWLIPKLQRQVNRLGKQRVVKVRRLSERISETVSGAVDIRAHGVGRYALAGFAHRLGEIFVVRERIYRKKFLMKFINNFLNQLTPLLFYSIGGILVIWGDLTFGALVAALAAYKDLSAPWKELLGYYQRLSDARIKYDQLCEQFVPKRLLPGGTPAAAAPLSGAMMLDKVSVTDEDGTPLLDGAAMVCAPAEKLAVLATEGGAAKDALAHALVGLIAPRSGAVRVGEDDLATADPGAVATTFGYVGPDSHLFNDTVAGNLYMGMRHRSPGESNEAEEARAAGNVPDDPHGDWVDYDRLGLDGGAAAAVWASKVLRAVEAEDDLYAVSLSARFAGDEDPQLADKLVAARKLCRRLARQEPRFARLIKPFEWGFYNTSASVAANLLYGEARDARLQASRLGHHPYVREILARCNLIEIFTSIGLKAAATVLELFRGLPPGDALFEHFSFVDGDTLARLKAVLMRYEAHGRAGLGRDDVDELLSLTLRLVPDRHRMGFVDVELQQRILVARRAFRLHLPADLTDAVEFYSDDRFTDTLTVRDNIINGRLNLSVPKADEKVAELIDRVVDRLGLRAALIALALRTGVGIGGGRFPLPARQKLLLARAAIKRPHFLVVNGGLSALDREARSRIVAGLTALLPDTGVVWLEAERPPDGVFDRIVTLRRGQILGDDGKVAELPSATRAPEPVAEDAGELDRDAARLAAVPLFAGIDRSRLKLLAYASRKLDFTVGEAIVTQGEPADGAYVLLHGEAEVWVGSRQVAVVGANQIVGELALLADQSRTATVRAAVPVTALKLDKETFLALLREDTGVAAELTRQIGQRLVDTLATMRAA